MAEYIEKQSALDAILREPPDAHYPSWYAERIKALPAADVVPVVMCKDCKHCGFCGKDTNLQVMGFYGYCSRGEK